MKLLSCSKFKMIFLTGLMAVTFFSFTYQLFGKQNKYNKQNKRNSVLAAPRDHIDHNQFNCQVPGSFTGSSVFTGNDYDQGDYPAALDYSPDEKYLAVVNYNSGTVASFSVGLGGLLTPLLFNAGINPVGAGCGPVALDYSPDGAFLAVANFDDDTVSVYSVGTGINGGQLTEISGSPFSTGDEPVSLHYSPDGAYLAVANFGNDDVTVFSVAGDGSLTPIGGSPFAAGDDPSSLDYSPDGKYLAVANADDDNVTVFQVNSGTGVLSSPVTFPAGSTPVSLNYSPDEKYLAVANFDSNNVTVFSVNSGTGALAQIATSPFDVGTNPNSLNYAPNSRSLAVANQGDNNITFFSVNSGTGELLPVEGSPIRTGSSPSTVQFAPICGNYFAVGNAGDGSVTEYTHCDVDDVN